MTRLQTESSAPSSLQPATALALEGMSAKLRRRIADLARQTGELRGQEGVPGLPAEKDPRPLQANAAVLLTRQQARVLDLLKQGQTYAEAARELQISPRTVAKHASAIYRRLNVENRYAASSKP